MTLAQKYGPWALITGASEGTGSAFARAVADAGINCILIARREGPLAELAADIRAKGVDCVTGSVDLAAPDASARIAAVAGEREVGLLIANAGADTNGSLFLDRDIADWDQLATMNVLTTMRNCHHFGRGMRARGRGGIIIVGSGACYGGLHGLAVYCAAKAFALTFGEALWSELGEHGVDVLNLILGRTDTPAHRLILAQSGQPVPEGMAQPEDVARVGLERLPHGPIHNWGEDENTVGMSAASPAQRRARLLAVKAMSQGYAIRQDA
jgi:short-subunit dehydrogenase